MENKNTDLIKPLTPEGDVLNKVAAYLNTHGSLNVLEIGNKVYTAVQNNSMTELREVEREVVRQVLENIKTFAIWEKWGE
jgi:predicted nucleotide-binding protein (sugar kinase/HSP70/actin superfamily)